MQGKEKKNWTARITERLLLTVVIMAISLVTLAQSKNSSVPGLYSMYGVREVASQLWLKEDGSFEFFFSYGALDRTGKGKWTPDANDTNRLILNSDARPALDFALTKSTQTKDKFTSIKISDPNTALLSYVFVRLHTATGIVEKRTDKEGYVIIPSQAIQKIELAFELCADRFSVFIPQQNNYNSFEFRFEPWIAEVFFKNIVLQKTDEGLKGNHPLLEGTGFTYEKADQ